MLARAIAEIALPDGNRLRSALDVVGTPRWRCWPPCWWRCLRWGAAPA